MKLFFHAINCVALTALLVSCTKSRPETTEYFETKTGIEICKSAKIENEKVSNFDNEIDFTYKVKIIFSESC